MTNIPPYMYIQCIYTLIYIDSAAVEVTRRGSLRLAPIIVTLR